MRKRERDRERCEKEKCDGERAWEIREISPPVDEKEGRGGRRRRRKETAPFPADPGKSSVSSTTDGGARAAREKSSN